MEGFSLGEPVRGECSLCVLTNQFLNYMAASSDKTVDLKQAAIDLQTRKRRIYDVTNVLEGVGLIRKTGTNTVQWVTPDESSPLSTRRFREVHARRLSRLRSLQERMEGCIAALKQSIHTLTSIPENMRMLYVTRRDLLNLEGLRGQQLTAVKAPAGSILTIPDPHRGVDPEWQGGPRFKAIISSKKGPLSVWLVVGPEEAQDRAHNSDDGAACQDDAPLSTPCQRSASPSRNAEAASASQLPTPQRSSHRMATRRQSGIVPARRKYYDDEEDASLELSPAICPVDTFGPPTPFPANARWPMRRLSTAKREQYTFRGFNGQCSI